VDQERNPDRFGRLQDELLEFPHTEADEIKWMNEQGPHSTELIQFIKKNKDSYQFFIFFSYRYFHSFYGVRTVPHKSILVPTAEPDAVIHFKIFKALFHLPQGFVYNSVEEKRLIQGLSANYQVPGDIVGVGSELPAATDAWSFRKKYNIHDPFLLYVGRIDQNKGCGNLFEYFLRYKAQDTSALKLVLIGSAVMEIPDHPSIAHLGFVNDQDKFDAMSACEILVMPSFYESLSMVLLEAWAMGKPTLANGNCRVLMGQTIRSNAGLFYTDYDEFLQSLVHLQRNPETRAIMGRNGKRFYEENYSWNIIEQKYLKLMDAVKN
jgi:glycosyltransferase involved in cell wall biosynthesis